MSTISSAPAVAPAPHLLRTVTRVCWFLLGALFIFSGLIKLNDPVGTAYKLEEYFEVFAVSVPPLEGFFLWFKNISRTLSIFLSSLEVILGVALVSEGVEGGYRDMLNYAVFALILRGEG